MIEVSKLNLRIEDTVIFNDFHMEFIENNIYWLQGPTGSGKTTFFKVLAGLYNNHFNSTNNHVEISHNQRTIPLNELRHFTNYIPAEPYLFEYLNGQQNIDYLIQLFDLSEKYNSIMNLINEFNLTPSLKKMVKDYSLGMKAQLYLSVTLHREKNIHLIDEIINSLDKTSQGIISAFISNKINNTDTIIVMTSHTKLDTSINYKVKKL